MPASKQKTKHAEVNVEVEKSNKKKKKWKAVPLNDLCFSMTLFPRPTRPEQLDCEAEEELWVKIEQDLDNFDKTVEKYRDFDVNHDVLFEGKITKADKLSRCDKHRRVRKARNQVKDKYCTSLRNNKGRKRLFIHHRLFKLINLEAKRLSLHLPSTSKYRELATSARNNSTTETRSKLKAPVPAPRPGGKKVPAQNLRFALQSTNAGAGLESDLVNMLVNIQNRDLTPEDYEILLRLDDTVAPKTIDKELLENLETDTVKEMTVGDMCTVCMEQYELDQTIKRLPCNHVFHAKCIDMWLEYSSRNCPIDGLPIDDHS